MNTSSLPFLTAYLQAHPELGLHWVPKDSPSSNAGCWEIIYITGHIPFDPGALASPDLEVLSERVPRPDGYLPFEITDYIRMCVEDYIAANHLRAAVPQGERARIIWAYESARTHGERQFTVRLIAAFEHLARIPSTQGIEG